MNKRDRWTLLISSVLSALCSYARAQELELVRVGSPPCVGFQLEASRPVEIPNVAFATGSITQVFENELHVELVPHPDKGPFPNPTLEVTVPLGSFAEGDWAVTVSWADGFGGDPVRLPFSVSEAESRCERIEGYRAGDVDESFSIDLTDAVLMLNHLFLGGELACIAAADASQDGVLNLGDPVLLLNFLFRGGTLPPVAFPECATVDSDGLLSCEEPHCSPTVPLPSSVWMAQADGCLQCEDCPNRSIEDVVRDLEASDFDVLDASMAFIGVCEACSCPSGRFWLVRVSLDDAAGLTEMGWSRWLDSQRGGGERL